MSRKRKHIMVRRSAIGPLCGLAGAILLGGCADLMQRSTIAPDWFQAKAVEVKGEGYPELAEVPQVRPSTGDQAEWTAAAADLKEKAAKFGMDASFTIRTDEEVRATAAQLRALLEGTEAAKDGVEP